MQNKPSVSLQSCKRTVGPTIHESNSITEPGATVIQLSSLFKLETCQVVVAHIPETDSQLQ